MAQFYSSFVFEKLYAHGVWWYFPVVILIKTTLGLLALLALAAIAVFTGCLRGKRREILYLLVPGTFYLAVAMFAGMNIGARHILPLYAMSAILAGAGLAALAASGRRWARIATWVGAALVVAHVASALSVFPNYMAYANEAWGGPKNTYKLLSDSNEDWAQQLYQVKDWQNRHPGDECWFAYFAFPVIDPAVYGIHCHHLPNADTGWFGNPEVVPPVISGNVILSAADLMGSEWSDNRLNPYMSFHALRPDAQIDYSVLVYRGTFRINQAAALSRVQRAYGLMHDHQPEQALTLAREAATLDPEGIEAQDALGNIAAKLGQKDEARKAWLAALASARQLEPDAQVSYIPDLEAKLKKL
jgi:tetratricopeptide (TPR) repeat protein